MQAVPVQAPTPSAVAAHHHPDRLEQRLLRVVLAPPRRLQGRADEQGGQDRPGHLRQGEAELKGAHSHQGVKETFIFQAYSLSILVNAFRANTCT